MVDAAIFVFPTEEVCPVPVSPSGLKSNYTKTNQCLFSVDPTMNVCRMNNGGCSHLCLPNRRGVSCACQPIRAQIKLYKNKSMFIFSGPNHECVQDE